MFVAQLFSEKKPICHSLALLYWFAAPLLFPIVDSPITFFFVRRLFVRNNILTHLFF